MKYLDFLNHFHNQLVISSQDIKNYFGEVNPVQLNQWANKGLIIQLRRGIYIFKNQEIDLNLIANEIKISYISLESALSYYQLIPEAVFGITSITAARPEKIKTSLGTFSYYHIKKELFFDYQLIDSKIKNRRFKIALPEKAIFDLVYLRKDLKDEPSLKELRLTAYNFSIRRLKGYQNYVKHRAVKNRIDNLINYLQNPC